MFDGKEFGHPNSCVFGIFAHVDPQLNDRYLLGLPFFENYYTIFNQDTDQVGFAIHIYSSAAVRQTFSGGIIALIAISVIVLFPLSILGLYMIYKIRRDKRSALLKSSHVEPVYEAILEDPKEENNFIVEEEKEKSV